MGGLPTIVSCLSSSSFELPYLLVQTVAQFAADKEYRTPLAEAEGLGASLTRLLASDESHVQQCALSALANISFVPRGAAQLVSSGALGGLGRLLRETEEVSVPLTAMVNLLAEAPRASVDSSTSCTEPPERLSSCTTLQSTEIELLSVCTALLEQLSSADPNYAAQAAMGIGHLCRHAPAMLRAMLEMDTVSLLCKLLHSPHLQPQMQV